MVFNPSKVNLKCTENKTDGGRKGWRETNARDEIQVAEDPLTRKALLYSVLLFLAAPAFGQADFAGNWAPLYHEKEPDGSKWTPSPCSAR
jgi:hypothetical protein